MHAIEIDQLQKSYGRHVALRGISFSVDEGEVVGFLGPNGAGKSTAMKIITGFISPSGGAAKVGGIDVVEDPIGAQKQIGYLPDPWVEQVKGQRLERFGDVIAEHERMLLADDPLDIARREREQTPAEASA